MPYIEHTSTGAKNTPALLEVNGDTFGFPLANLLIRLDERGKTLAAEPDPYSGEQIVTTWANQHYGVSGRVASVTCSSSGDRNSTFVSSLEVFNGLDAVTYPAIKIRPMLVTNELYPYTTIWRWGGFKKDSPGIYTSNGDITDGYTIAMVARIQLPEYQTIDDPRTAGDNPVLIQNPAYTGQTNILFNNYWLTGGTGATHDAFAITGERRPPLPAALIYPETCKSWLSGSFADVGNLGHMHDELALIIVTNTMTPDVGAKSMTFDQIVYLPEKGCLFGSWAGGIYAASKTTVGSTSSNTSLNNLSIGYKSVNSAGGQSMFGDVMEYALWGKVLTGIEIWKLIKYYRGKWNCV